MTTFRKWELTAERKPLREFLLGLDDPEIRTTIDFDVERAHARAERRAALGEDEDASFAEEFARTLTR